MLSQIFQTMDQRILHITSTVMLGRLYHEYYGHLLLAGGWEKSADWAGAPAEKLPAASAT